MKRCADKILRLNRAYAKTISGEFYENNRFPAYCYDKLVGGLMDSHRLANDPDAYRILEQTTNTAMPHLPGKAIEHERKWRADKKRDVYAGLSRTRWRRIYFWRTSAAQENGIVRWARRISMMSTSIRWPQDGAISKAGTRTAT